MVDHPIVVVGAGIGGLAAALSMLRSGIDVEVYERSAQLGEVGAGLHVSPNGARVLDALGLGAAVDKATGRSTHPRVMRLWNTGDAWPVPGQAEDAVARYGAPYLLLHRADLHAILAAAVQAEKSDAIHLRKQFCDFEELRDGVRIRFADDTAVEGRALVAADGIRSRARELLFGAASPKFSGYIYWRGLVPMSRVPAGLQDRSTGWLGPDNFITLYPIQANRFLNFNATARRSEWSTESWTEAGTHEEMLADFLGWHPDVIELIKNIETPYRWGSFLRQPLARWTVGRVTLLGDACHPMHSSLGQGANITLEDGVVLGRCLRDFGDDITQAFSHYEAARRPRASDVVTASSEMRVRRLNPKLANPEAASAEMDKMWSPAEVRRSYDWIFSYDAAVVPV